MLVQIDAVSKASPRSLGMSQQMKLNFFHGIILSNILMEDTRQSFGGTALLLQGGATFGLYHLGVVKALNEAKLLPRVICGSSG